MEQLATKDTPQWQSKCEDVQAYDIRCVIGLLRPVQSYL